MSNQRALLLSALSSILTVSLCGLNLNQRVMATEPGHPPRPLVGTSEGDEIDWKQDPVCQMVFFAVLEGLYTDGVQSQVIDSLIPTASNDSVLKKNFVAECPLCQPVFEALVVYQRRERFRNGSDKPSTFGPGLSQEECEGLGSDSRQARLKTLRPLVRRWVERRLSLMRLDESERTAWATKLESRSRQGKQKLMHLMRTDPAYRDGWSPYWGCAACNGTTDAFQPKHGNISTPTRLK